MLSSEWLIWMLLNPILVRWAIQMLINIVSTKFIAILKLLHLCNQVKLVNKLKIKSEVKLSIGLSLTTEKEI